MLLSQVHLLILEKMIKWRNILAGLQKYWIPRGVILRSSLLPQEKYWEFCHWVQHETIQVHSILYFP